MAKKEEYYLGKYKILFGKLVDKENVLILQAPMYDSDVREMLNTLPEDRPVIVHVKDWLTSDVIAIKARYSVIIETGFRKVVGCIVPMIQEERVKHIIDKFSFYSPDEDPIVKSIYEEDHPIVGVPLWFEKSIDDFSTREAIGSRPTDEIYTTKVKCYISKEELSEFKVRGKGFESLIKRRIVGKITEAIFEDFDKYIDMNVEVLMEGEEYTGRINILKHDK